MTENTTDCTTPYKLNWVKSTRGIAQLSLLVFSLFFSFSLLGQTIDVYSFKKEIDKLKKDRKVEKYWRELYRDDRDNARLKIPMDYTFVLNRLKAAYLIEQYGFPTPDRFGKQSSITFLSIVMNNCFSDLNTLTFPQVLPGNSLRLWGNKYPNALMVNELFWYNGIEIALDQEYALALGKLEKRTMEGISIDSLCQKSNELLKMLQSPDTRLVGEWVMNYRELIIPLQIYRLKDKYYLKKGKYYFELIRKDPRIYVFAHQLDETTLYIFENGELVLRDKYEREMGIFPVASKKE